MAGSLTVLWAKVPLKWLPPDPSRAIQRDSAHPENRCGIPHAAGLEVTAEPFEIGTHLGEFQHQVHPLLRTQIFGSERLPSHRDEPCAERFEPIAPQSNAGRHVVTAVAVQQVAAALQRSMQVEPGDAPARAFADVALEGHEKSRPPVAFDHSRGDDPDDARMPALGREHERRASCSASTSRST